LAAKGSTRRCARRSTSSSQTGTRPRSISTPNRASKEPKGTSIMTMATRRDLLRVLVAALAISVLIIRVNASAENKDPVAFAAASLKDAPDAVNATWKKETGKQATISYAASSALAKQIEQGAPADVFVSADEDWMNYLADRKLIKPDSRFDLLGNSLML